MENWTTLCGVPRMEVGTSRRAAILGIGRHSNGVFPVIFPCPQTMTATEKPTTAFVVHRTNFGTLRRVAIPHPQLCGSTGFQPIFLQPTSMLTCLERVFMF